MRTLLLPLTFLFSLASVSALDLSVVGLFKDQGSHQALLDHASLGFSVDVPTTAHGSLLVLDAVRFEDTGSEDGDYNRNIHWDANLLYAYHLFGHEHFFDPYLSFGAGCSGAVYFDENARQWQTRTQLVLFPAAGAGVSLRFEELVLGAMIRGQVLSFNPSPLRTYEQLPVALAVSVGLGL